MCVVPTLSPCRPSLSSCMMSLSFGRLPLPRLPAAPALPPTSKYDQQLANHFKRQIVIDKLARDGYSLADPSTVGSTLLLQQQLLGKQHAAADANANTLLEELQAPSADHADVDGSTTYLHTSCSICNDELGPDQRTHLICCTHTFCLDCISEWTLHASTCPQCRRPITEMWLWSRGADKQLRRQVKRVATKLQGRQLAEDEQEESSVDEQLQQVATCFACGSTHAAHTIISCSGCTRSYHMHHVPTATPMLVLPQHAWYCSEECETNGDYVYDDMTVKDADVGQESPTVSVVDSDEELHEELRQLHDTDGDDGTDKPGGQRAQCSKEEIADHGFEVQLHQQRHMHKKRKRKRKRTRTHRDRSDTVSSEQLRNGRTNIQTLNDLPEQQSSVDSIDRSIPNVLQRSRRKLNPSDLNGDDLVKSANSAPSSQYWELMHQQAQRQLELVRLKQERDALYDEPTSKYLGKIKKAGKRQQPAHSDDSDDEYQALKQQLASHFT